MERLCFLIELVPGSEAEYDRRHDEIWPEMRRAVSAAGYTNYTLFRRGSTVVGYADGGLLRAAEVWHL
ncbi:L-rhamnose mutarotase [Spongiactinospora sp. 9N601]|uniref:L-rhamnose mutarotase n=1 Tax=Spongiactinospora sp. 9N601 TaxID=3375149 RepID=UPI0037BB5950